MKVAMLLLDLRSHSFTLQSSEGVTKIDVLGTVLGIMLGNIPDLY
jgi:hypothetical protein